MHGKGFTSASSSAGGVGRAARSASQRKNKRRAKNGDARGRPRCQPSGLNSESKDNGTGQVEDSNWGPDGALRLTQHSQALF